MAGLDSFQIVRGTLLFKVFQFRNLVKGSVNVLYCKNVSQTLNELTSSSSLLESHPLPLPSYLLRLQTTGGNNFKKKERRNKVDYISTMDYLIEVFAFYIVPQARLQNAKLFSILA